MTKTFEEEAKEKILNSSRLYIAHEGAHADVDKGGGMALKIMDVVYVFPWLEFARNWHSDEEFQELFDKFSNLNDNYEKEVIRSSKLEDQNIGLKFQLQQQALPVVPECVAEWYEEHKDDLDYSIYIFCTDFYKNTDCPGKELTKFENWFDNDSNQPIETLIRMQDGYTVEKPQLFYLREKNTNYYLNKSKNNGLELVPNPYFDEDNQFTKQEIDSMQTGSYEQIPVPVEDNK